MMKETVESEKKRRQGYKTKKGGHIKIHRDNVWGQKG